MTKPGKKYRAQLLKVNSEKLYGLEEAVALVKDTSPTKFDASVEVHVKLTIDPSQAEQNVRSTVPLPHGTGKNVRVVAFVDDSMVKDALAAGAVKAGSGELIEEIVKGWLDFDVAVAHPTLMKDLGKIARNLGQKGLMPNPKAGTVTPDVVKAIGEVKKGKVEFRNDKQANLHNVVGKVSFDAKALQENIETYLKAVMAHRPSAAKGRFLQTITLCSTMGPGIHVDVGPFVA